ncbi:MAG TPA: Rossmann-like and DUF2520 domain-containing protein [Thermoanaerobaculaceae bacterium]|nr:Rossmann-like and DUF2520 domain-containing protein [Thermoanaerobaculaceae bacterium]
MVSKWLLVGAGRCGLQLARAMTAAGIEVAGVVVRSTRGRSRVRRFLPGVPAVDSGASLPPASGILLAVPDSAIRPCAQRLAPLLDTTTSVALHTSGLLPGAELAPLSKRGCTVGSLHPLVSFPTATGPRVALAGVTATVEGAQKAVRAAQRLARALGMRPVPLSAAAKPRYHAAAALASNMTYALVAAARAQLVRTGLPQRVVTSALRPLVIGTVEAALSARGFEKLTGPIARADAAAVRLHLEALPGRVATAYWAAAWLAIAGLLEQGLISEKQAQELGLALTRQA